ncbi:MAG TPA: hypothetical protein VFN35_12835, partial [Ktedonobacteraceae bacterium]|nr:hypothetical protein [Ktedonobacteraceae bacterium]
MRASAISAKTKGSDADPNSQAHALHATDLTLVEQEILLRAQTARNAADFQVLWDGGDPRDRRKADGSPDHSAADFELIQRLLYWSYDNAEQVNRLFRASKRYRPEKGNGKTCRQRLSYLERSIQKAILYRQQGTRRTKSDRAVTSNPPDPDYNPNQEAKQVPLRSDTGRTRAQRQPVHRDHRLLHAPPWSNTNETREQRQHLLEQTALQVTRQVEAHIRSHCQDRVLIEAVAPGVGKTHSVAPLGLPGTGLKLAWIAERRDMREQVPALQQYRLIDPCTRFNCPQGYHLHEMLAEKSRNTMPAHKRHRVPCAYTRQFESNESAFYQLAHVRTRHPANSDGIVLDELDINKWLPEREISIRLLQATLKMYPTESTADRLIRACQATITDAMQAKESLHGWDLFEALDRRCDGHLRSWIGELAQDARHLDTHPWTELEENEAAAQELEVDQLAPIVLPHLLGALIRELVKWERGSAWNSCLRIGRGLHGWGLFITEPLRFTAHGKDGLPARAVLDATAPDEEILTRILGEQVEIKRAEVAPPPNTRHLAIRTGKRYGLTSLCAQPYKDGKPVPNRYLLR